MLRRSLLMKFFSRFLVASICILGLSGCLHLSQDLLSPVEISPSPFKPFVEYQVSPNFQVSTPGGGYIKLATSNKIGRELMNEALQRWKKKGYIAGFEYINHTRGDFTVDSELRLILGGSGTMKSNVGLQVLSGLTLLVIPVYGEQTFDVTVMGTRADLEGREFHAAAKEGVEEWIQLFLLPTMFFAPGVDSDARARVGDHVYLQLQEQGAFENPAPGFERSDAALKALQGNTESAPKRRGPRHRR
jgi:hypothetical protein